MSKEGDWLWARAQYETTQRSCDDIGTEVGETATSIISRASRYGWTRNKLAQSVERSAELVLVTKLTKEDEARLKYEAIEKVNTAMKAEVLATHRKDIRSARKVCQEMFKTLHEQASDMDPENRLTLDTASKIVQRLAVAMKTFVLLERQAYGIVGVYEDPEIAEVSGTIPISALDSVMNKFASVLQARERVPTVKDMGEVFENGAS